MRSGKPRRRTPSRRGKGLSLPYLTLAVSLWARRLWKNGRNEGLGCTAMMPGHLDDPGDQDRLFGEREGGTGEGGRVKVGDICTQALPPRRLAGSGSR